MDKNIKLIDNLKNAQSYEQYSVLYCMATDWDKFGTADFKYNLHRRLCDYMGYNFLSLSKGQKSYIKRLSNILEDPHYFYYFVKNLVMSLDYVSFLSACEEYERG